MQRALVISFTIFYAFLSTGIAVNLHYCQGQFEKLALIDLDTNQDPYSCPAEPAEEDCCENQPVFLKFSPEQVIVFTRGSDPSNVVAGNSNLSSSPENSFISSPIKSQPGEANRYVTPPLWLVYCNLTYYS